MERRVLLAFLLSLLVLLVYQSLVAPPPARPPEGTGTAAPAPSPPAAVAPEQSPARGGTPTPALPPADSETAPGEEITPVVADQEVREVVVETDRVRAVFRNRGASPFSWLLKEHLDQETGMPIDLVPGELPDGELPPFSLVFEDPELTARAADALYRPSAQRVAITDRPETLAFEFEDSSGFRVRKEYEFEPGVHGYLVRFRASAFEGDNRLAPRGRMGAGPGRRGGVEFGNGLSRGAARPGRGPRRWKRRAHWTEEDVWRQDAGGCRGTTRSTDGQFRYRRRRQPLLSSRLR